MGKRPCCPRAPRTFSAASFVTDTAQLVQPPEGRDSPSPRVYLVGPKGVRAWGLTGAERYARVCARHGAAVADWPGAPPAGGSVVLFRRDSVIQPDIVGGLLNGPDCVLMDEDGATALAAKVPAERAAEAVRFLETALWVEPGREPPARTLKPEEVAGSYDKALRKLRSRPIARIVDAENRSRTERALFTGAYKGVTDVVTKYLWPYPSYYLTQISARIGLSPNVVTLVSIALTVAAFLLFLEGQFAWGLACGWGMALLDTVDGKLARVTVRSSDIGNVLDHGTDLVHPPFWYGAWLYGLHLTGAMEGPWGWIAWLTIGGYVVSRLEEAVFLHRYKMQLHVWRRFDSWFRLVSARRNPHLIVLTLLALLGQPYFAIAIVAAWTGVTVLEHAVRILQGELAHRNGPLQSWMDRG